MESVEELGRHYGLKLNWKKVEAMSARCQGCLTNADGAPIPDKESLVYLGALISKDGRMDSEVSRRLGVASEELRRLRKIWSHANIVSYGSLIQRLHTADGYIGGRIQEFLIQYFLP